MSEENKIKTYRKDGNIVIEIPEETLIFAVENNPDGAVKVYDKEQFLNFVAESVVEEVGFNHDSGLSSFHRLLDETAEEAIEGDKGVEPLDVDF